MTREKEILLLRENLKVARKNKDVMTIKYIIVRLKEINPDDIGNRINNPLYIPKIINN